MMRPRLRFRFVVAVSLLVVTTITASVWTFLALNRLSGIATDTIRQSESVTAVTSRLAGALEREDDAVLLILAGDQRGRQVLARERAVVDEALADLFSVLSPEDERKLAHPLQLELATYRQAADGVISVPEAVALVQYHQKANPVLRRAVTLTTTIRDRHFEIARNAVARARDEAGAARRAVLLITLAALGIAAAVAWHLTRTVVGPVRRLTQGANALRQGRFSERIEVPSRDELGELAAVFNQMAEDLSEFRRTNISEVLRAKNTLEATLEALPDVVVLFDENGQIQSMNRAAVTALESAGIREPRSLEELRLDGLELDAVRKAIIADSDVAQPADLARTIRLEQDGAVRRLLPRVVPVSTLNPQQAGAILLLYDVTDLVRLDEMRSELIAVASHELQTPLTTLRMTLLMLQEASQQFQERERELVATSLIGVEQLSETVHEFLDLTRIEAGELRLNFEPVRISLVIGEAIRRVDGQAKAQGIALNYTPDPDLPRINGDPQRLRAVFDNILSNALKYTPAGGTVTVEAHQTDLSASGEPASVTIAVSDTGPGVPTSFRSRIFEKFFRLEHHQSEAHSVARGAGIGLYMCRQIVELHGGNISCRAGVDGRGACIVVGLRACSLSDTSVVNDSPDFVGRQSIG